MSKIARYQGNVRAFASDAQGMERTVFGGTNQADDLTSQITASFLRGWGVVGASEHPSLEDFNAAMYAMSQFIAYQHQMGVAEWHAQQEYHIGSICTHNGESYQSLQDANVGSQPPSAKWTPVLTSKNGLVNLGLGTAAKKNAQSNAFDSTLGALMLVGAFGFGGVGADLANTAITNVYTLPIGDKGNPEPYQNYVHINLAGTSFYSSRIALSMNGTDNPRIFIKSRSGATESEWTEVFTSRNPPKSVATLTTARKISVSGDASGYAMFNGGSDADISVTVADSAKGVIRLREGSVSTVGTSTTNFISIDTGFLVRGITFTAGAQTVNVRPLQMLIGTTWVTVGLS